jgi:hypothetical protein
MKAAPDDGAARRITRSTGHNVASRSRRPAAQQPDLFASGPPDEPVVDLPGSTPETVGGCSSGDEEVALPGVVPM